MIIILTLPQDNVMLAYSYLHNSESMLSHHSYCISLNEIYDVSYLKFSSIPSLGYCQLQVNVLDTNTSIVNLLQYKYTTYQN